MHLNKKGMTLIEVIVVLLLSSILMVIAGGLLLNSMGYLIVRHKAIMRSRLWMLFHPM